MTKEMIIEANRAGLNGESHSYYTPVLQVSMNLGFDGVDLSFAPIVKGYRYGDAPERFISMNHAEGIMENGLSLACIDGEKEVGSSIWFTDREKVYYSGILSDRGSDGEAVILAFESECWD